MTILHETSGAGSFIVSEANGTLSREIVTVASSAALLAGTVLGKITASGKYVQLAPAAEDGSEAAAAILYADADASAADVEGVAVVREAEIDAAALIWPTGATDPQKVTATSQLAALNIIAR